MNLRVVRSKWIIGVFILILSLSLTGCNVWSNGPAGREPAMVNQVEVVTSLGNPPRYFAVASGILPDGCTKLGRARQRVLATTIKITLLTQPAEGTCSQLAAVSFRERIPLRVNGLSAGSYTLDVNGAVTSFFLTENH